MRCQPGVPKTTAAVPSLGTVVVVSGALVVVVVDPSDVEVDLGARVVVVGAAVYFFSARALGLEEAQTLLRRIRR